MGGSRQEPPGTFASKLNCFPTYVSSVGHVIKKAPLRGRGGLNSGDVH